MNFAASSITPNLKELESGCQQIWDLVHQIRALQTDVDVLAAGDAVDSKSD